MPKTNEANSQNLTKSEMRTLLIEMFAYDAAIATRPLKL